MYYREGMYSIETGNQIENNDFAELKYTLFPLWNNIYFANTENFYG